jgi:2,3-bisphosphoglycerate-independent phosphoglycerate mutase
MSDTGTNRTIQEDMKKNIIVIMDGAADRLRVDGKSPLEIARTPHLDYITKHSRIGRMQTLYPDLPKDSVVAQLGLLGYDPYEYFPLGRSYFEVPDGVKVEEDDLIFRVNFVYFDQEEVLESYNGNGITSEAARQVVSRLNERCAGQFPDFKLYNNSAFRNTLIIRNVGKLDFKIKYWEPHEEEGTSFLNKELLASPIEHPLVKRLNEYIRFIKNNTGSTQTNGIFPWGYSYPVQLPAFSENLNGCVIGNMDFLNGFSKEMGLDFFKIGNSNWDTDYEGKGRILSRELQADNYHFIYCHINGPDEASHMHDLEKKVYSIEQIDQHILQPIANALKEQAYRINSVAVCPDHYTNIEAGNKEGTRREAHSMDPVPFIIWDNDRKDTAERFSERTALEGYFGEKVFNHLELLKMMKLGQEVMPQKV